ncbi:MAG: hypothetical protein ACQCN3_02770 [Candidatus Bathyarchaeia archaeon]
MEARSLANNHTGGQPIKVNNAKSTFLWRMDPQLKKDVDDIAKTKKESLNVFLTNLAIKAVAEVKGNPQAAKTLNLKQAQDEIVKLHREIQQKQKLLGYMKDTPSKKYRELEELCVNLGLKEDLSNLEKVTLLLVDYKPDVSDAFTKADLGIFQFILAQMKEAKLKQAEYNAALKQGNNPPEQTKPITGGKELELKH